MDSQSITQFQNKLLQWYVSNARILPWREEPTPYRVWISEIMLQQTRVDTVKPYFENFMKAVPTIQDLADISEDQLLKLWEGLGYYISAQSIQEDSSFIWATLEQIKEQYSIPTAFKTYMKFINESEK